MRNEAEIVGSEVCTCMYCGYEFSPSIVTPPEEHSNLWQPDGPPGERTATCPLCLIDAVVGDGGGFPVTDPHFKARCAREWFNGYAKMEDDEPPRPIEYRRIDVE